MTASLLSHQDRRWLYAGKCSLEMCVVDAVPFLFTHVEKHAISENAGAGHEYVDLAEGIEGGLDDIFPALHRGDAIVVRCSLSTRLPDLVHDDICCFCRSAVASG